MCAVAGGGLALWWGSVTVLRQKVFLRSNTAGDDGGGIYSTVATVTMERDVTIENCATATFGGCFYARTRTWVFMWDGVVIRNCEAYSAAGMWIRESLLTMERNISVMDNTAVWTGGAIRLETPVTHVYMAQDVRLSGNRAGWGGAVYMDDTVSMHAEQGVFFENNSATHDGGCLYLTGSSQVTLNGTALRGCSAALRGGAVFVEKSSTLAIHSSAVVASAAEHGGGVFALSGPLLIAGSTLDSNAAVQDGGGLLATQGTAVTIIGSRFVQCRAGKHGGGLDLQGSARAVVTGANVFEHNTARYGGGLAVRLLADLAVQSGSLSVLHNEARAQGGGIFSDSSLSFEGGSSLLAWNRAAEGGGLCAVTYASRIYLRHDHTLRVFNCSAQTGGGVALLEQAAFEFEWLDACRVECEADTCDLACLKPECNFANGQCAERFEQTDPDALTACDRSQCSFQMQEWTASCYEECMVSSCDWGEDNPHCRAHLQSLSACPLFDAAAYHSASSQPGLVYVEGGTAGGYGRCNANGCSARTEGNATVSACQTVDDQGTLQAQQCENCPSHDSGVESWGVCAQRPRLPVSGWDYDEAMLEAVWKMPLGEALARFPGCGSAPLILENNSAAHFGGGLWQDTCNGVLEASGRCFVGGMDARTQATVWVQVRGNTADVGGAVATGCSNFEACDPLLAQTLGLPSAKHPRPTSLSMSDNVASGYGTDVATGPAHMVVEQGRASPYVPGQSVLDVRVTLLDAHQQVIRASRVELDYLLMLLVCPVEGPCSQSSAVQPAAFLAYSSGPVEVLASQVLLQTCDSVANGVVLQLSLVREKLAAIQGLNQRVSVPCAPCQAGQTTVTTETEGKVLRTCTACSRSQYCVDPLKAEYGCEACPRGALCASGECLLRHWPRLNATCESGELLVGDWELDPEPGRLRLVSCPARHELVTSVDGVFAPSVQQCRPCTALEYVVNPNEQGCQPCPASCECDGEALSDPVAGAVWTANLQTGVYVLESCPPGYSLQALKSLSGSFVATEQQCLPCTPGLQYILSPNTDVCQDCPTGARCDGSTLEGLVPGSQWEAREDGVMVLRSCPPGFQRNSLAEGYAVTAQECLQCTPGLQYILNPNTDRCQDCPTGLRCHGDDTLDPVLEGSHWVKDGAVFRLEHCPPGTQLVNSRDGISGPAFAAEQQECRACRPKEYIVDPDADLCHPCPLGTWTDPPACPAMCCFLCACWR
eukprot:3748372-Rhodomonas_salina.1